MVAGVVADDVWGDELQQNAEDFGLSGVDSQESIVSHGKLLIGFYKQ